jgi:poly-gamma-glutamate synthase PgsB/CapB
VEYWSHKRDLASIPIRIHVNGTRGKSSVTRLITAAVNEAGIRCFGKTTGTLPRMIFPDGREFPVYRPGGHSNVLEQIRILAVAHAHKAQAAVVECMALQPRLQVLCEDKLVQATHGVITNAREDHLDVMGPTERDVALALLGMTPRNKSMFTCEVRNLDLFKAACKDRNCKLVPVPPEAADAITDEEMSHFCYDEHKENVALVLAICADLGISREVALRGMYKARPDAGALKRFELDFFGRRMIFVNAFAANDPESTGRIWRTAVEKHRDVDKKIAVFNLRADRQQRSQQLAEAYVTWPQADAVLLMGTGTFVFAREAAKHHLDDSVLHFAEGLDAQPVFEAIVGLVGKSALVVGMGNVAGPGLPLVRHFENRSKIGEGGYRW